MPFFMRTDLRKGNKKMSILEFYKGKKVFITGHTGFKGSWLSYILLRAGAEVIGFSLCPPTSPSLFECGYAGRSTFR